MVKLRRSKDVDWEMQLDEYDEDTITRALERDAAYHEWVHRLHVQSMQHNVERTQDA